jgi:hypothetical protein
MNPWEGAVKAVYADSYLKALAATCNVKRAQDAAFARIAKGIEAAVDVARRYDPEGLGLDECHAAVLAAFSEVSR